MLEEFLVEKKKIENNRRPRENCQISNRQVSDRLVKFAFQNLSPTDSRLSRVKLVRGM